MSHSFLDKVVLLLDWNKKKVILQCSESNISFEERDIWWASLGENIGSEVNGKNHRFERPIIIIKKFSKDMFLAVPCTTQEKKGSWYHPVMFDGVERIAIMAQLRTMSNRRLIRKMGQISVEHFMPLQEAIVDLIKTKPAGLIAGISDPLSRAM